jgi:hypothetical protein
VDDNGALRDGGLQKYDIVKLLNFSPVVFGLFRQPLASGC